MKINSYRELRSWLHSCGYSLQSSNRHEKWAHQSGHTINIPHGHTKHFSIYLAKRFQKEVNNHLDKTKSATIV